MKKIASLSILFLSLLWISGCDSKSNEGAPAAPSTPSAPATPAAGAYPLKTCVVSGKELGSMGDPVVYTHEGKEVRFCCKACIEPFKADAAKFVAKIDEAGKKK